MPAPLVSIVIPTFRRPEALAHALASALAQNLGDLTAEIVVVDNDPGGSAHPILPSSSVAPVRYVHAPEPGVANARNAGVAAARGALIAFLDDDEIAPPGWLMAMVEVQRGLDADAVFGPVRTLLPDETVEHRAYFDHFFSRIGPASPGLIEQAYGCGCSLVRRAALPGPEPFSPTRNQSGGEDDLMFAGMKARGARFAFAPEAWVWEAPEPSRVSLGYTLRRAFAYGQGPCSAAAARGGIGWLTVPVHMAVGAAQAFGFGLVGFGDWLIRSPMLPFSLDRAARGLGKVLWFSPFKIGFYARAAQAARPIRGVTHGHHRRLDGGDSEGLHPREPRLSSPAA